MEGLWSVLGVNSKRSRAPCHTPFQVFRHVGCGDDDEAAVARHDAFPKGCPGHARLGVR